jgi:hypothetical protein
MIDRRKGIFVVASKNIKNKKSKDKKKDTSVIGLLSFAFTLGMLVALVEIFYKIDSKYGLSQGEIVVWMLYGLPLYGIVALCFSFCFSYSRSSYGFTFGTLFALQSLLWYIFSFRSQQLTFDLEHWFISFLICSSCIIVGWVLDVILRQGLQTLFLLVLIIFSVIILQQGRTPIGKLRQDEYNVLFITIDDLSHIKDIFPSYIDQGVLFSSVYTTGSSRSSIHQSLFSGEHVYQSEIYGVPEKGQTIFSNRATKNWLPEVLQRKDYTTAAFVSHREISSKWGWNRGFSIYGDSSSIPSGLERMFLIQGYNYFRGIDNRSRNVEGTIDRGLIWIAEHYLEPFFLWIHLQEKDPQQMTRLIKRMENLGLWENTLVVVTSAKTSYKKVPLWLFFKKRLKPQKIACDISNVQVQATILEYLSFSVSEHSMSEILEDGICNPRTIASSFKNDAGIQHHFRRENIHWFWEGKHLICMQREKSDISEQEQIYTCPENAQETFLSNIRMKSPTFDYTWENLLSK